MPYATAIAVLIALGALWFFSSIVSAILSITLGQMLSMLVFFAFGYGAGRVSGDEQRGIIPMSFQVFDKLKGRWVEKAKGKARRNR